MKNKIRVFPQVFKQLIDHTFNWQKQGQNKQLPLTGIE